VLHNKEYTFLFTYLLTRSKYAKYASLCVFVHTYVGNVRDVGRGGSLVDLVHSGLLICDWSFLARLHDPSSQGLYGPKVARLAAKQQIGVAPFCRYITAHGPSMARLLNAARAIFGPPGIFK